MTHTPTAPSTGFVPDEARRRTADLSSHTLFKLQVSACAGSVQWKQPAVEEVVNLFPNYEVTAILGRGGMGAVYQAKHRHLDRKVAIKLLPRERTASPASIELFAREAKALAALHHPQVVAIHDFGLIAEDQPFFVMEFVEGTSLHTLLQQKNLSVIQAIKILVDICNGLACAHAKNIIHRDLKPANILIDLEGQAKVADFGLALVQAPEGSESSDPGSQAAGTPAYMAPEQRARKPIDHRADLYALGMIIFECLCFRLPHDADSKPTSFRPVPAAFDDLVYSLLRPVPGDREQSADSVRAKLEEIARGMSTELPCTSGNLNTPDRFRGWRLKGAFVLGIIVVALTGLGIWKAQAPQNESTAINPTIASAVRKQEPAASDLWSDWIEETLRVQGSIPELVREEGGYRIASTSGDQWVELKVVSRTKDQAVRITYQSDDEAALIQVMLRRSVGGDEYYSAKGYANRWRVSRGSSGKTRHLFDLPRTTSPVPASPLRVIEFRVWGNTVSLIENGTREDSKEDSRISEGIGVVRVHTGTILTKVEWLANP